MFPPRPKPLQPAAGIRERRCMACWRRCGRAPRSGRGGGCCSCTRAGCWACTTRRRSCSPLWRRRGGPTACGWTEAGAGGGGAGVGAGASWLAPHASRRPPSAVPCLVRATVRLEEGRAPTGGDPHPEGRPEGQPISCVACRFSALVSPRRCIHSFPVPRLSTLRPVRMASALSAKISVRGQAIVAARPAARRVAAK